MQHEVAKFRAGRSREWRVNLTGAGLIEDHTRPGEFFTPDLAILYVSADDDCAPFDQLRIHVSAKQDHLRMIQSNRFDNSSPNPEYSIRRCPDWLKALFAEVTGEDRLINTYSGPAWSTDMYERIAPMDPNYPLPD